MVESLFKFPPLIIWSQFCDAFLEKYVPSSLRERLVDLFSDLIKGSLSIAVYEALFHEFARHAAMLMPIE